MADCWTWAVFSNFVILLSEVYYSQYHSSCAHVNVVLVTSNTFACTLKAGWGRDGALLQIHWYVYRTLIQPRTRPQPSFNAHRAIRRRPSLYSYCNILLLSCVTGFIIQGNLYCFGLWWLWPRLSGSDFKTEKANKNKLRNKFISRFDNKS